VNRGTDPKEYTQVNLCIKLVTKPRPGTWPQLLILVVILLVVTLPVIRAGYNLPDLVTFLLGAGVAGAQATRPLPAIRVQDVL
jgi:hypothetical protein